MKFTIIENNPGIRETRVVHSQEVQKIELTELTDSSITGSLKAEAETSVVHDGAKILQGVEKSYDKGKFLLDESRSEEGFQRNQSYQSTRRTAREEAEDVARKRSEQTGMRVEVDDIPMRVKITMKESRIPVINTPHSYEVTEIELLDKMPSSELEPNARANLLIGTAKILQGVEKSYDKGKFLLDESRSAEEFQRNQSYQSTRRSAREEAEEVARKRSEQTEMRVEVDYGMADRGGYDPTTGRVRVNPQMHERAEDMDVTIYVDYVSYVAPPVRPPGADAPSKRM